MKIWDEFITNLKQDIAEVAKKLNPQKKSEYCERCGRPAIMHEGKHHFCLKHWKEWVAEE